MLIASILKFLRRGQEPLPREELNELEDHALLARYVAGDAAAFEVVFDRHERSVFRFVLRSTGDTERAAEITQDAFMKVVSHAKSYKPTAKFRTWLFAIVRNLCIDEARKNKRRRTLSLDAPVADGAGETFVDRLLDANASGGTSEIEKKAFLAHLQEGLAALPDEQREVFLLSQVEGLRFVEIARILEISDNTVKSRMRYALATLRGYLASFEGTSFSEVARDEVGGGGT
ncbi:MAG: RNA polymerase sigma-70 factor (ECF subfamily) [Bradymonadia bacterium]